MFILPPLTYSYAALEPTISERTMRIHHGRHHARYVATTNNLLAAHDHPQASLEEVIRAASAWNDAALFNNAAQAWNHAFFWVSMTPQTYLPCGKLARAIEAYPGGLEGLKHAFIQAGLGHFGSGWVWLLAQEGALSVATTHDGATALLRDETPLLVCDLWEHAYYLDYANDRESYLTAWWDRLADWAFAAGQLEAAKHHRAPWTYGAEAQEYERS